MLECFQRDFFLLTVDKLRKQVKEALTKLFNRYHDTQGEAVKTLYMNYKRRTWKLGPTVSYQAVKLGVFKLLLCIFFNQ